MEDIHFNNSFINEHIEQIDNPSAHTRCQCGITYFILDNNPCLACDCEFFLEYERDRFGYDNEEE